MEQKNFYKLQQRLRDTCRAFFGNLTTKIYINKRDRKIKFSSKERKSLKFFELQRYEQKHTGHLPTHGTGEVEVMGAIPRISSRR